MIGAALLDLVLPRACVSCGGTMPGGIVCDLCFSRLARLPEPTCERCGQPRTESECAYCPALPAFVRAARSVCWVPETVGSAVVHALKYEGWTAVADGMAERMSRLHWPRDVIEERTAVVPVPLARTRLRERGYNQAALLAGALARRWRIPHWDDLLVRTRHTPTQTRLTPSERFTNVQHAFRVNDLAPSVQSRLVGAHLIMVDDVLTTGSTLNAAASALFDAGARVVSYVTFGRARSAAD